MKKSEFITIMDQAILQTELFRDGSFTCLNIDAGISTLIGKQHYYKLEDHELKTEYAKTLGVLRKTMMQKFKETPSEEVLKNTRLAALELFKEMMLATGGYKGIKL